MNELLTVPEAAEMTRFKPSTVRDWILKRKIPFVKLGGRVFLRRSDIERLIADSLVPADPAEAPKGEQSDGNVLSTREGRNAP